MRNGMGSWHFVGGALLFLALWMVLNSWLLHNGGFDPYPYILLNLTLSCVAALQGAILLIAAKRADQVSTALSQHDYETDKVSLAHLKDIHAHLNDLNEQLGLKPPKRVDG